MAVLTGGDIKRTARVAGILYLLLVPLGFYSFVYVPSVLALHGDADAASRHIISSERLVRTGIASHLVSQIVVVFLALTLYRLLCVVNRDRAVTMVVLALICVPISFLSEVNSLAALHLLQRTSEGALTSHQLGEQAILFLGMQRSGVLLAQVFWGLWLLPLSSLVVASRFLPRWLGLPVLIAAAGYLIDSARHVLLPGGQSISQFTAVGELALPLWLVTKGIDRQRWIEQGTSGTCQG